MERNNKSAPSQKKTYQTLPGMVFDLLFKLALLSILAWFILMIWFTYKAVLGNLGANIQAITDFNLSFLLQHQSTLFVNKIQSLVVYDGPEKWLSSITNSGVIEIVFGSLSIILIRLCIFIISLPCLALLLSIACIDGLVMRDIRKYVVARESTLFFHRTKKTPDLFIFIAFLIYLAMPWIEPQYVLLPMYFVFCIFATLAIKNFKKYI